MIENSFSRELVRNFSLNSRADRAKSTSTWWFQNDFLNMSPTFNRFLHGHAWPNAFTTKVKRFIQWGAQERIWGPMKEYQDLWFTCNSLSGANKRSAFLSRRKWFEKCVFFGVDSAFFFAISTTFFSFTSPRVSLVRCRIRHAILKPMVYVQPTEWYQFLRPFEWKRSNLRAYQRVMASGRKCNFLCLCDKTSCMFDLGL